MNVRLFHLLEKHQRIDDQLRAEIARPQPDMGRLQQLKRLKLAIKDRIARRAFKLRMV